MAHDPDARTVLTHLRLVERVARRFVAGDVVPFKAKPGVPTEVIGGRKYVLSSDGGPLGDQVEGTPGWFGGGEPSEGGARLVPNLQPIENKWRFLWAYDTDRKYVGMWRVTDGNEKEGGSDKHYGAKIVALEKKGQLNRVTRAEFDVIEREMRKREHEQLESLKEWVERDKTDYQRAVDKIARDLYEKVAVPKIKRAIADIQGGAIPLGFKSNPHVPRPPEHQMTVHVVGQVMAREVSEEKILDAIRHAGYDPDAPGHDIQAAYWAAGDLRDEAYEAFVQR